MATSSRPFDLHEYGSPAVTAEALAARVADDLQAAIRARGSAFLALGGGRTPARFLAVLGTRDLDWPRVHVTLTDERWVQAGHPRANATMIADTMMRGGARHCVWHPLYQDAPSIEEGVRQLNAGLRSCPWPLDVVVLGMGDDGHVASLFPGPGPWRAPNGADPLIAATSPTGEARVSLTLDALGAARQRYLLIHGAAKRALLESTAIAGLPVGAVLADTGARVAVFHALEDE